MTKTFSYSLLFILFIFFSCKKKEDPKDTQAPQVTFKTPGANVVFNMFDTISVSAYVSDETQLTSVSVSLLNSNYQSVQSAVPVAVSSRAFTFTIDYMLYEYHLTTGDYYLMVTANDGHNTGHGYQKIHIVESPTEIWGYCVNLKNQPAQIIRYDTAMQQVSVFPLSNSYNGMRYAPYNRLLYVNDNGSQLLKAYDLNYNTQAFSETPTGNQQKITALYSDGTKAYCGFYNADISSFSVSGGISTSYRINNTSGNIYCSLLGTSSANAFAVFRNKIHGNLSQFASFYLNSGSLLNIVNITINPVALFEKDPDNIYVFGNDTLAGSTFMYQYMVSSNGFSAYNFLNQAGQIKSVIQINTDLYMVSLDNAAYFFTASTSNLVSAGIQAQKLAYNNKLGIIIAGYNTNISNYKIVSGALVQLNTHILPDSLIDFEVISNK